MRYKKLYNQYQIKLTVRLSNPLKLDPWFFKKPIKYCIVVTQLYNECTSIGITNEYCELALGIQKILEAYDHATKICFNVHEPNTHLVISELITIFTSLLTTSLQQ